MAWICGVVSASSWPVPSAPMSSVERPAMAPTLIAAISSDVNVAI
jgi:hypothetical protein